MKRLFLLGAPLLGVCHLAVAAESQSLEYTIVTAPLPKSLEATALPVTVFSGDELRRHAAGTIGDTLSLSPGLNNASFGPGVGRPVIRGQQGARVQVLQNGLPSQDAASISADHAIAVEPLLAESVEVLRGPATLLYGGGAIGGVVNVIDNRIPVAVEQPLSGALELRRDSASDAEVAVFKAEGAASGFGWYLDGMDRRWSDLEIPGLAFNRDTLDDVSESGRGRVENSDGETRTYTVGAAYRVGRGYAGVSVSVLDNEYGIPNGEEAGEHGIRIAVNQTRWDAAVGVDEPLPGLDQLSLKLSHSDYEHEEIEGSGEVGTQFGNDGLAARLLVLHQPLAGWRGALGVQFTDSDFAALGEESFIPETRRREIGVFLVEDREAFGGTLEAGLRLDGSRQDPAGGLASQDFDSLSGSLSWLRPLSENWQLALAFSRARRAPTTEELYSNAGNAPADLVEHHASHSIEVGDADLDEEQANNLDVTLSWEYRRADGFVTVFHNEFHDFIFLRNTGVEIGEFPVYQYAQEDARFSGVEYELGWALYRGSAGTFRAEWFGDAIQGALEDDGNVPRLPPMRSGLRLDYHRSGFVTALTWLHAFGQDRPGAGERETQGYDRLDLEASYRLRAGGLGYMVFVRGKNLTDDTIRASTSFLRDFAPEAGRSVELGLRIEFGAAGG